MRRSNGPPSSRTVGGGLAPPPAPFYEGYEGGPRILDAHCPDELATGGRSFSAGDCRVSMAHSFMVGPDGGAESLASAAHARRWATTVTRVTRKAVDALEFGDFEPVLEVQDVTDSWWRGKDSLIAVYRGKAVGLDAPRCLEAHIYGGLDEWALRGG